MSLKKGTDREAGEIQIGDTVRLLPTATSCDGTILSPWVKKEQWIVDNIEGNRLILNQNEKGEHNIMTAVHRKNAVKVVNWNEERKVASSEASKENQ